MFCDFYNPKEQSYCKRLLVLCPEHNPDPKIGDDEVWNMNMHNSYEFKMTHKAQPLG